MCKMGFKEFFLTVFVLGAASAQVFRVCVPENLQSSTCQSIGKDDSQAACRRVYSRLDCALQLARGEADIGYFSEEETLLLSQQQPNDNRVIATVRDVNKMDPVAFETVAIVPSTHTTGLAGLRGGVYCHPGLDETEIRWSPRVRKNLEQVVARTDACSDPNVAGKTAEEVEVEIVNNFFSAACRPGTWSHNATVDASLKSRFPNLCSLCGPNSDCSRYTIDMGVSVAGASNDNRHIQALECLRSNSNATAAVAYVAWQHVREYFTLRNPGDAASFSVLCTDGSVMSLTAETLNNSSAPCTFLQQPWGAIVASSFTANTLLTNLRTWWPTGANPGGNTWQAILFNVLAGGANARVVYQDTPVSLLNYTTPIRSIASIDATASCLPARRWCTTSALEQTKCNWVRAAAYTLGIEPTLSCQQRASVLECLSDIKNERVDFISAPSNYGYLARQHYQLTPVKLVQNDAGATSRVAAFVKESAAAAGNITRFENLRGKNACFPEFGGLAYVSFVRAGQERGILSASECDYAKAVGEFFGGACAPGAVDASHALTETSSFNSSVLCSTCRSAVPTNETEICSWDFTNLYFGNNGTLACLADENNDVAFLNIQNIKSDIRALNLSETQFRALCRNNSLALTAGIELPDDCLLAHVIDAEIVTRRTDPLYNSLNTLFDTLNYYFGYDTTSQLIDLQIFSPFDGVSDLLFKDSTIDLTEPTISSNHGPARRYIELFQHLQACTGTAPPVQGLATRSLYSIVTLITMALMTRFVIY